MAKDNNNAINMLPHLLGIFTGFLGALIVLLASSNKDLKEHSKKALNWQFSLLIYYIISMVLVIILIGILGLIVLGILNLVFTIMAAIKASEGNLWDYPLSIKFFK